MITASAVLRQQSAHIMPLSGRVPSSPYDRSVNGQLALLAALAAVGGRWLRDDRWKPPPDLLRSNSSFQYVSQFTAEVRGRGLLRGSSTVTDPDGWLRALRAEGTTDLSLITNLAAAGPLPPHIASAFSNSGTWGLLATGRGRPTLWLIRWEVGDREAPDRRTWSLTASGSPGDGFSQPGAGLTEARGRLRAALGEIRAFATATSELHDWARWFAKSEALLDDTAPAAPYHQDILPPDASLERRQLAAAVVQAWVFGGMGSWNDGGLADRAAHREYERVGAVLYSALLLALPAAVNGS
jgi:hypothetical protein